MENPTKNQKTLETRRGKSACYSILSRYNSIRSGKTGEKTRKQTKA